MAMEPDGRWIRPATVIAGLSFVLLMTFAWIREGQILAVIEAGNVSSETRVWVERRMDLTVCESEIWRQIRLAVRVGMVDWHYEVGSATTSATIRVGEVEYTGIAGGTPAYPVLHFHKLENEEYQSLHKEHKDYRDAVQQFSLFFDLSTKECRNWDR